MPPFPPAGMGGGGGMPGIPGGGGGGGAVDALEGGRGGGGGGAAVVGLAVLGCGLSVFIFLDGGWIVSGTKEEDTTRDPVSILG